MQIPHNAMSPLRKIMFWHRLAMCAKNFQKHPIWGQYPGPFLPMKKLPQTLSRGFQALCKISRENIMKTLCKISCENVMQNILWKCYVKYPVKKLYKISCENVLQNILGKCSAKYPVKLSCKMSCENVIKNILCKIFWENVMENLL